MYYEVNSQTEENALTLANGDIVVRLDLLPQPPPPPPPAGQPIVAYTLTPETNFASAALTAPDSNDLDFGAGNFEINFDFKLANLSTPNTHQTFFSKGTNLNNAWYLMYTAGNFMISTSNNNAIINVASGITAINTWFNLKLKRVNGVTTLYLNDVSKGTTTLSLIDTTGQLYIGAWNYTPSAHRFLGSMRNVVITKG